MSQPYSNHWLATGLTERLWALYRGLGGLTRSGSGACCLTADHSPTCSFPKLACQPAASGPWHALLPRPGHCPSSCPCGLASVTCKSLPKSHLCRGLLCPPMQRSPTSPTILLPTCGPQSSQRHLTRHCCSDGQFLKRMHGYTRAPGTVATRAVLPGCTGVA